MCGINGIYNVGTGEPVRRLVLKGMADTMVHRGPDDEGYFISGPVGLGHRRLSIIDLVGGRQPMTNEDKSVCVAFNGEIYNFPELGEEGIKRGFTFRTHSDTEVIVHLYKERGENCFQYLRGMFAVAIWDAERRQLVLARDRVGKKPLYYSYDGSRLVFASELKGLLVVPGIPRDLDLEALSDYLALRYVPAPKSIFRSIRKIRPGHYLVISPMGIRETEYWDLSFSPISDMAEEEWIGRLSEEEFSVTGPPERRKAQIAGMLKEILG